MRITRITARFAADERAAIDAAAKRYGLTPAGFVGNAAVAFALGRTDPRSAQDPQQSLLDRLEAMTKQLRYIGVNLNQITKAIHSGTIPIQTETALAAIEQAAKSTYRAMDELADQHGNGGQG